MPVFNSKCNWINWVPTKELQHQETQNNLHYQPHTETKSTRSDSSEVLLRSLMDVLWNAESTAWLVLPWATIIWILGPSFTLWCEGSAHTPSCLHKWDYMCRLRASEFPTDQNCTCGPHTPNYSPPALLITGNLLWQWHDLISSFNLCIFIFKSV